MALTPGPQEIEFSNWYATKFKPAMERGPLDKYVARQAWFAAAAPLLERIAGLEKCLFQMQNAAIDLAKQVEQAAQPVHYRAILAEEQRQHQLKTAMHVVGFRTWKAADDFVASEQDMNGWRYTIEPLYTAPKAVPLTEEQQVRKEHEPGPVNLWDGTPAKYGIAPADKPAAERWICLDCLSSVKDTHKPGCRSAKQPDIDAALETHKLPLPNCPKCGDNRQVWRNQVTGLLTCHRINCHTVIEGNT